MDFENLGLKIGDVLQIELTSQPGSRYPVKLIGVCPNKGFITSTPVNSSGNLMFLKEGQAIVIRFVSLKSVIAFNTHILEDRSKPYPHLHIAMPPKIQSVEVRQAIRIDMNLPATIINEDTESKPVNMTITNLSPHGAKLEGQFDIAKEGETISSTMQLNAAGYDYTISIMGEVMSAGISNSENDKAKKELKSGYYFGIKFEQIDEEDAAPLYAYIYQKILQKNGLIE